MTKDFFSEWLHSVDASMRKQKRKILLFIDNCTAHGDIPTLRNVNINFLPANTTSVLQPLDQGIIRNFKVHYRRQVVEHIIAAIEESNDLSINVLHAIRMAALAWDTVSPTTISNCFRKCGFSLPVREEEPLNVDIDDAAWNRVCVTLNVSNPLTFYDYVDVDQDVETVGDLNDEEIIAEISNNSGTPDDKDDEIDDLPELEPVITRKEALHSIKNLRAYYKTCEEVPPTFFSMLNDLQRLAEMQNNVVQTKITSYFSVE